MCLCECLCELMPHVCKCSPHVNERHVCASVSVWMSVWVNAICLQEFPCKCLCEWTPCASLPMWMNVCVNERHVCASVPVWVSLWVNTMCVQAFSCECLCEWTPCVCKCSHVSVCVSECHACAGSLETDAGVGSRRTGVTGICEQFDVGIGNWP